MAELEPGHPDEPAQMLRNWLREAHSPIGSLPTGTDPVEWAVRQFIDSWQAQARGTIELIEECLGAAAGACEAGDLQQARIDIESAQQLVRESLRDDLGLYVWNNAEPGNSSGGPRAGDWPHPFSAVESPETKSSFEAELQRELKPGHPLFGLPVAAIGRRFDQDDVVFEVLDGSSRVAEVHLTWAGERERPPWPATSLFDSFAAWAASVRDEYS